MVGFVQGSYKPGLCQGSGSRTEEEVIRLWLIGKSTTTQKLYQRTIRDFFKVVTGKTLAQLKVDDLLNWSLTLRNKTSTVQTKIRIVKSFFTFCQTIGYLQFNLGKPLKTPPSKDERGCKMLEKEEIKKFINTAANHRDKTLFALIYSCGLRMSEATNLLWSDLIARGDGGQAIIFGKGGKTRTVLIPSNVWTMLQQIPKTFCPNVFISNRRKPLSTTNVHLILKKMAKAAGLPTQFSTHWLRHSHASHALESGCDLVLLQQSLGHSSLSTTQVYLHLRPGQGSSQFVSI